MKKCELCNGEICKCDKPIKVSFCPRCKSRDVRYIFELKNIFGIIPKMRCGKCGYESSTFPLLVTNKKLLEKSDKTKKKVIKRKIGGRKR